MGLLPKSSAIPIVGSVSRTEKKKNIVIEGKGGEWKRIHVPRLCCTSKIMKQQGVISKAGNLQAKWETQHRTGRSANNGKKQGEKVDLCDKQVFLDGNENRALVCMQEKEEKR